MKNADKKPRKLYLRVVILTVLCVSCIPVFILSTFSYLSNRRIIEEELVQDGVTNLKQTVNAVDIIMNQIYDGCRQLSMDQAIAEYLSVTYTNYYEKLDITQSDKARIEYEEYYQRKQRAIRRLHAMKVSNRYIKSIYLYSFESGLVLGDSGGTYNVDELPDSSWKTVADSTDTFPVILPPDPGSANSEKAHTITLLFSNLDASFIKRFVLVVTLDSDSLYNIFKRIDSRIQSDYVILSSAGEIVIGRSSREDIKRFTEKAAALKDANTFRMEMLNETWDTYFITFLKSEASDWIFYNIRNVDHVFRSLSYIRLTLVISVSIVAIILLLLTWYSVRMLYSPVQLMLSLVEDHGRERQLMRVRSDGEIGIISNSIREVYRKGAYLEKRLSESLPVYKEKYLLSLVKGRYGSPEEMEGKLRFLNINIKLQGLVPVIVSGLRFHESGSIENQYIRMIHLKEQLLEKLRDKYRHEVCEDDNGRILVLFNCEENVDKQLDLFLENICMELEAELQYPVMMGVGAWCKKVEGLRKAYQAADQASKHGIFQGNGGVYHVDELRLQAADKQDVSDEKIDQVLNNIRSGDADTAVRLFLLLLKELALEGKTDRYHVHTLFLKLVAGMMRIAADTRTELEENEDRKISLIDKLNTRSETEIIQWLKKIIPHLAEKAKKVMYENETRHAERVMEMLEKECGRNVSLEWAADQLGLNPAYLSRLFRETTGTTFVEHLTRIRMNKAKKLLIESEMMVKDIADALGYANDHYFIQVFRKHAGVTPREFRETVKAGKTLWL